MEDATHLLQYRRFFGILFSVLPGLELTYGLAGLVLWILADLAGLDFGWGAGLAAITFALTLSGWLFVGMGIQKWAEDKSAGFLFGINVPFLLIFAVAMGWLFYASVLAGHEPGAADNARLLVESARVFV